MSQPPVPGHHREELRSPTSAPKTTAPVVHSFTSSATLPPDPPPRLRRLLHIADGMMNTGIHEFGWTVERGPDGHATFRRPNGRVYDVGPTALRPEVRRYLTAVPLLC